MKRFFLFAISLFLSIGASNAFGASILVSQTVGIDGYGGSAWSNMTSALDSATGNKVSVVSNFEDLNLMLTYDALWLDLRGRGVNDPPDLLSAVEVANLTSFINTGRFVVMMGEWGCIEGQEPCYVEDWNNQILGLVGGTFGGTSEVNPIDVVVQNELTNGVNQLHTGGFGVAIGGTALFDPNLATLWQGNVLTVLDEGVFSDTNWTKNENAQFATNVANWAANSNAQAQCEEDLAQALVDLEQALIELEECQNGCTPTHKKEKGPRCTDGLDNDCDGLIDSEDPDCK